MRDRELVRLYWPLELRPAFDALLAIDDAMADVVATSTQPALGAIRLAWWREALQRLDTSPPPAEPRLIAAAAELLARGVTGARLAEMEGGYAELLDEQPDFGRTGLAGEALLRAGATLLGADDPKLPLAGRLYGLAMAARRGFAPVLGGEEVQQLEGYRFRRALRPLTAFARLAARDVRRAPVLEPEATPGRAAALLAHRWSGIVA
jgi:15-cis-phytoene synthase